MLLHNKTMFSNVRIFSLKDGFISHAFSESSFPFRIFYSNKGLSKSFGITPSFRGTNPVLTSFASLSLGVARATTKLFFTIKTVFNFHKFIISYS